MIFALVALLGRSIFSALATLRIATIPRLLTRYPRVKCGSTSVTFVSVERTPSTHLELARIPVSVLRIRSRIDAPCHNLVVGHS